LAPLLKDTMLSRYGVGDSARRWRSVTPVALPFAPGRSRTGSQRQATESAAAEALAAAMRHGDIATRATDIRIQNEPFQARGLPATAFDAGRFAARLRHVEVTFEQPLPGPIVIGDARFVGLGLLRPVKEEIPDLHIFGIARADAPPIAQAIVVASALRRAVMARAQAVIGDRRPLPAFFTGHAADGEPVRTGSHEHLFFLAQDTDGDGLIDRLAVVSPNLVDRTAHRSRPHLQQLAQALDGLSLLIAGRAGVLSPRPLGVPELGDRTFGVARTWTSATDYRPTRHPKRDFDLRAFLRDDILVECKRRGLPTVSVELIRIAVGPRGGLAVRATLRFSRSIMGPIMLGRGAHMGEGVFIAQP
jgi:CRISPR-associated protein Csb2